VFSYSIPLPPSLDLLDELLALFPGKRTRPLIPLSLSSFCGPLTMSSSLSAHQPGCATHWFFHLESTRKPLGIQMRNFNKEISARSNLGDVSLWWAVFFGVGLRVGSFFGLGLGGGVCMCTRSSFASWRGVFVVWFVGFLFFLLGFFFFGGLWFSVCGVVLSSFFLLLCWFVLCVWASALFLVFFFFFFWGFSSVFAHSPRVFHFQLTQEDLVP